MPWTDLDRLRALSERVDLDPLQLQTAPADLELIRLINERILSLDPVDHSAALRISRVHQAWAKRARTTELKAHHNMQRSVWLMEALVRDPPPRRRRTIEHALGARAADLAAPARERATAAIAQLDAMSLPTELIRLARSLREDEPRLPHLACVAAHRAVAYADREAAGETHPRLASDRYAARASLGASLRATRRAADAVAIAHEAVKLDRKSPVGWTVLIGATRDLAGPDAAIEIVEQAVIATGRDAAQGDRYLALAAAAAYQQAGRPAEAGHWLRAALTDDLDHSARSDVLARMRWVIARLRERSQHQDADELALLIAAVGAPRGP